MGSDVLTRPVEAAPGVHRLAPGTELLGEYQGSGLQEPRYLVRRSDGQVMQLPGLLYRVASSLDGVHDDAWIAEALSRETGQDLTGEQVSFLVEERLRPVGIIAAEADPAGETATAPVPVRSDPLLALRYRVGAVPASAVWRVAGLFLPFFRRPVWITALAALVALDVTIVLQGGLTNGLLDGGYALIRHPELSLLIIALTLVGGAFHECGHVGACRYGGATPGDMGFGLYIVWPALYSTVTDAYRLDRVGRLRTDLGGVYFNAIFMAGLSGVYLLTGQSWLLIALIGLHVETAVQFLPSIRLDGYYILADLVGVPDLFSYLGPALKSLLPRRPTHPRVLQLRPWPRRVIVGWVAATVPLLLFYLGLALTLLPELLPAVWSGVLEFLREIRVAAATGEVAQTTLSVFQLFMLVLPWVGSVLITWTTVRLLYRWLALRRGPRTAPRRVGRWVAAVPWAALRRQAALVALLAIGVLLVVRVARTAVTHPTSAAETRLSASALAAVHGVQGSPSVGWTEFLTQEQLVWYARLTWAFDRHATVVGAGRELAVAATAVLVACLVTLVVAGHIRPLAATLSLLAALAMGPAVITLATLGPGVVGAAWTAVGVLLLAEARGRVMSLLGVLALTIGVATQPLLAAPITVGVVLASGCVPGMARRRPARPKHAVPGPPTGAHRRPTGGHRRPTGGHRRRLVAALLSPVVGVAVLAAARGELPLDGSERTVLLLVAGVVVVAGLIVRRLRPVAAGAACAVLLAVLPWSGAGNALSVALTVVALLAALLTDAVTEGPVESRPHPLLRAAVAVPVLLLVGVGALFVPTTAPRPPVAELAHWITGPASGGGAVAVPPELWGELLHDGVPPERLVSYGSGSAREAAWTVTVGGPGQAEPPEATFGSDPAALTVRTSSEEEARRFAEETQR